MTTTPRRFSAELALAALPAILLVTVDVSCGAKGPYVYGGDAGVDANGATDSSSPDFATFADLRLSPDTAANVDGPAKVDVPASEAFAAIAGTYSGKAANVSGPAAAFFDNGSAYMLIVTAAGDVSITSKMGNLVFTWSANGKEIKRNSANGVTRISLEDPGKKTIDLVYASGIGLFDVSGTILETNATGAWFLSQPQKQ